MNVEVIFQFIGLTFTADVSIAEDLDFEVLSLKVGKDDASFLLESDLSDKILDIVLKGS